MYEIIINFFEQPVIPIKKGDTTAHLAWCVQEVFQKLKLTEIDNAMESFESNMKLTKTTETIFKDSTNQWQTLLGKMKSMYETDKLSTAFSINTQYNGAIKVCIKNTALEKKPPNDNISLLKPGT